MGCGKLRPGISSHRTLRSRPCQSQGMLARALLIPRQCAISTVYGVERAVGYESLDGKARCLTINIRHPSTPCDATGIFYGLL
ncbi:hypothetical protein Ddc_16717 [Ditylenchus destructor]|nr:hypothetical protein Ddc_16717 [Ditylenchus destructor]